VLVDFLTGECATQPSMRATSGSACVNFNEQVGHQLQRSAATVLSLCQKSVKRQHPWQKATSSRLLCLAKMLTEVLL